MQNLHSDRGCLEFLEKSRRSYNCASILRLLVLETQPAAGRSMTPKQRPRQVSSQRDEPACNQQLVAADALPRRPQTAKREHTCARTNSCMPNMHPTLGHPTLGHPTLGHPTLGHPTLGHPTPRTRHRAPDTAHPTPRTRHRAPDARSRAARKTRNARLREPRCKTSHSHLEHRSLVWF
jgi:hypothetical protein